MTIFDAIAILLAIFALRQIRELGKRVKSLETRKPEPEKRVQTPVQLVKQATQYEKPVVPGAKPVKAVQIGDGKLNFDEQNQVAEWV